MPNSVTCTYHYLIPAVAGAPAEERQGRISLDPQQAKQMQVDDVPVVAFDSSWPEEHVVDIHHARREEPATLLRAADRSRWDLERLRRQAGTVPFARGRQAQDP